MINYKYSRLHLLLAVFIFFTTAQLSALELTDPDKALKQYVEHQDNTFKMQHIVSIPGAGFTAHLYNLTSQKWLTDVELDRSIWTHSLVMIVPDMVNTTTSLLFVAGEDNDDPLPDSNNPTVQVITQLALGSQSIVSAVFQVPNQPIVFENNGIPTEEDKLVAISWKNAINKANYINVAYLPMVKSVVRAMDGIQSVIADHGDYQINDFVLTGFSKRGATVWLSAAVDSRIKAIAPGVIDFLNVIPSFEHHYKSYGEFSSAVHDYVDEKITEDLRAPEFKDLAKVIDPYSYIDQLTMPKYLLNSSGDQFFLPDSSRFYFNELKGDKLMRFAPNTDHSLSNSVSGVEDSLYSLIGWYQSILYDLPRPEISWRQENKQLIAKTNLPPVAVKVWSSYNASARDFRKETIGESWTSRFLPLNNNGEYSVVLPESPQGFHGTFIEFIYTGAAGLPVTYSTRVYVSPDVYPFNLTDPVLKPNASSYWKRQLRKLLYGKDSLIDESTWLSYLPVALFDETLKDLDDVKDTLLFNSFPGFDDIAQRECLATRLNIRAGEMGWYSEVDLGHYLGNKALWEHYQLAHDKAESLPVLSSYICHQLNKQ